MLLPRTRGEWALFVAAPLAMSVCTRTDSPQRNYGAYHMAHGLWGVWCLWKGVGFLRHWGWAPFDLQKSAEIIPPEVPRGWLRDFGLYLLSELSWATVISDWPMFRHHIPLLLFYKFAQDYAVTQVGFPPSSVSRHHCWRVLCSAESSAELLLCIRQPMIISMVESINIPAGIEGLMRWYPPLFTPARARAMRTLKLLIILGLRMPLNFVMLAMSSRQHSKHETPSEPDNRVTDHSLACADSSRYGNDEKALAARRRAVRAFSLVWLLLDLDLLMRLWRSSRRVITAK